MCRATGFCQFYHPPCIDQQATAKRKTSVAGDVSRDTPSPLLAKLPEIEEGVARKMIPAERTVMLHMVSRAVQAAMDSVILTARIQIQRNQPLDDKLAAQYTECSGVELLPSISPRLPSEPRGLRGWRLCCSSVLFWHI